MNNESKTRKKVVLLISRRPLSPLQRPRERGNGKRANARFLFLSRFFVFWLLLFLWIPSGSLCEVEGDVPTIFACVADALNILYRGLYKWFRRVRGPAAAKAILSESLVQGILVWFEPTFVTISLQFLHSPLKKPKGNWSRNVSHNCFWDRYWWLAGQLLANCFLCP